MPMAFGSGDLVETTFEGGYPLERLTEIQRSVANLDVRLARQEERTESMRTTFEHAEVRLFQVVGELRAVMVERFEALDKMLTIGNGKPSFDQRIRKLEDRSNTEDGGTAASRQIWEVIKPVVYPIVLLFLGAAAFYFVQQSGHLK